MAISGPVRLSDVARAAGVSLGTASNVFNKPERVRLEVRERVEGAARELGYAGPDPKARVLMRGKVNAIGVVMGGTGGIAHWFDTGYGREFMTGVAEACDEVGAAVTLVADVSGEPGAGVGSALVDGFILHRVEEVELVGRVKHRRLPFVVMDTDAVPDASSVLIDYRAAARLAAGHLTGLGHRRFAILSVLRESGRAPIFHAASARVPELAYALPPDRERLLGFADGLAAAGIAIADMPVVEGFFHPPGAAAAAALLLDRAPEATAILTMSDALALAVLGEVRRRGIAVPRDLSVVGFDDIAEAATADPPLTTIAQPTVEKGRVAARLLLAGGPPRHVVLPVELIVRGSTGPPRS